MNDPYSIMGLQFRNRVGLAAGFDKNAQYIRELQLLGFGFIEIGTVTPRPQAGNPKPRLFRLTRDKALINRMGFNNDGVTVIAKRLETLQNRKIIIGGNIGKNKDTANENAVNDYIHCFNTLFDLVDYFVVNISSPNTPGLRELQEKEPLKALLHSIQSINSGKLQPKPILLKIAPDLSRHQLDEIIQIVSDVQLTGIIATNTTIDRQHLKTDNSKLKRIGNGGLSGAPIREKSTGILEYISQQNKELTLIGSGGIDNGQAALEKIRAGAHLVQIYTGLIYEGPSLIRECAEQIMLIRSQSVH